MRRDWADLPEALRNAIEQRIGPVGSVQPASVGRSADFTSTLRTAQGRTFVKAAQRSTVQDGPQVRSLRREVTLAPYMSEFAPRLLWHFQAGEWLALGFEYVEGRHADYSPGSPDLDLVAKTVQRVLQSFPCPAAVEMKVERRWEALTDDVSPIAGDSLLHTDLNPANLLLTPDGRVRVVDRGFASRGAPWVEMGQIIPWLIRAGHSSAGAEEWAEQFPAWSSADPGAIDLYARVSAERWRRYNAANPTPQVPHYVTVAQQRAAYRLHDLNSRGQSIV